MTACIERCIGSLCFIQVRPSFIWKYCNKYFLGEKKKQKKKQDLFLDGGGED